MHKYVNLVDLVKSSSNEYLLSSIGVRSISEEFSSAPALLCFLITVLLMIGCQMVFQKLAFALRNTFYIGIDEYA